MYNIYDSIFNNSGEGIQDIKIFYDSIFLNTKVLDSTSCFNILLIDKIGYEFSDGSFSNNNRSIIMNFGDTGYSEPFLSNGNTVVDFVLDPKDKSVLIISLQKEASYIIPNIHKYNLNGHSIKKIFPLENDNSWDGFTNYDYDETQIPFIHHDITNGLLRVFFVTKNGGTNMLNIITFYIRNDSVETKSYEMLSYVEIMKFKGATNDHVLYNIDGKYGLLKYK